MFRLFILGLFSIVGLAALTSVATLLMSGNGEAQCNAPAVLDSLFMPCSSQISATTTAPLPPPLDYLEVVNFESPPISLRRVSSNEVFEAKDGRARHQYSRRQAWSADEKYLDIGDRILDASNYDILDIDIPMSSERVWSNVEPGVLFGFRFIDNTLNQFVWYQVKTNTWQEIILLSDYEKCSIGRGEGTLSNRDERVLFICISSDDADGSATLISYSLEDNEILGKLTTQDDVNWAGFSQLANFIVVESRPDPDSAKVLIRYSPTLQESVLLTDDRHHGDFGVDDNGDDVFVMIGPDNISYIALDDGSVVSLPISSFRRPLEHGHLSCRNLQRPGWCYFSANNGIIGAVKIADAGRFQFPAFIDARQGVFEFWGYHFSSRASYHAQPKLVPSPSGRAVLFTSDWDGTAEINDYIATPLKLP